MFGHRVAGVLVDRQESFAGAPIPIVQVLVGLMAWRPSCRVNIHLADELAAEGVDDAGHGGRASLADKIKVQHALDGSGLHATVMIVSKTAPTRRHSMRSPTR